MGVKTYMACRGFAVAARPEALYIAYGRDYVRAEGTSVFCLSWSILNVSGHVAG